MDKREFLKTSFLAGLGATVAFDSLAKKMAEVESIDPSLLAEDDDFWTGIRGGYRLKEEYVNLENGYYCMMPKEIEDATVDHLREVNYQASYYMRKINKQTKVKVRTKLAELAGCSVDELVVTRNATESLDLVIQGLKWKAGDEAIMAEQDYGAMLDMFRLVGERYGVVSKKVMIPNDPKSDDEIVRLYENQITDKTRLIMVCHMVNITGHILPVKKIIDMAHARGVEVMVDGAHSFAHIPTNLSEMGCDYYGTSLHKWLSAPLGSGMLFVRKKKIKNLWPLLAENAKKAEDDILRLNHTGTRPVYTDLGILDAIEFYDKVGAERKEKRLRYLKDYWMKGLEGVKGVYFNTPSDSSRACAIGNVGVEGFEPIQLANKLFKHHNIWTVAINRPGVKGVRITPNIYTTTAELDQFITAVKSLSEMVGSGQQQGGNGQNGNRNGGNSNK